MEQKFKHQAEIFSSKSPIFNSGSVSWQSPSNIAFVKYWGKYGQQMPCNPSLSLTLKNANTTTKVDYQLNKSGFELEFYLDQQRNQKFEERLLKYLISIEEYFPFLKNIRLKIYSENSFPHSTGIASSASGLSALALCICNIEYDLLNKEIDKEFYQKASYFARLGSGSACRSLWGPWVSWGEFDEEEKGSNLSGLEIDFQNKFHHLGDAVLIVSAGEKSVSSTKGHGLMKNHPFAKARFEQAKTNQSELYKSISENNFGKFIEIVESEALSLHAMMMTSNPGFMLFHPNSIEIINTIREKRAKDGLKMCFTLDAGPNIHLIYSLDDREKVLEFINSDLKQFCQDQKWIDDQFGLGPLKIS